MKKTLLFLCLLIGTMGSSVVKADPITSASQLSNSKAYTINTARGAWTINTDGTTVASTHKKTSEDKDTEYDGADQTTEAQEFAIYKQGDFYHIYNLKANKFVDFNGTNSTAPLYEYATIPYTVLTSNSDTYPLIIATFDSRNYANNNNDGGIPINSWKEQDNGNRLAIEEARDLTSAEITAIDNALAASPLLNKHKAFTITANRGQWCASSDGNSLSTTTVNTSPATDYDKFALMFLDNKFYLYNVGTKKFIKNDGSLNADAGDEISIRHSGDNNRPYMFYFPDGPVYFNMQGGGGSYAMNTYSTPDDGNKQSVSQANIVYMGEMLAKFELAPALAAITDGSYHITTVKNGVKYYLTSAGKFTLSVAESETFEITQTSGGTFGTGIRISTATDRFTNAPMSGSVANLNPGNYAHSTGDRTDWERQVFFLNDEGKFAIRSSNVGSSASSWNDCGRTFWTYTLEEANLTPCYSYEPAYVWELEEPGDPIDVTYNIYFGGNKVKEKTITMEDGAAAILPSDVDCGFCTYTYDPATITSGVTEVNVTATWTGPFEISEDFEHAHWYDMAIRSTWYVTSNNKEDGALKTVNANALGLAENDYQWAFTGDPWHIKVLNKAEGSTKCFGHPTEENEGVPVFGTDEYTWFIKKSTSGIANSFVMNVSGTNLYINQYGGAGGLLKFWNSGNNIGDLGSAFTVFDVPTDFHEYAVAEIQPYVTPTGYFALKDAVKSSIGWDDDYATDCPFETYKSMKETLMAIDMTDLSNFNIPETGYYLLKNKNYGTYMGIDPSDANMYGNYANANLPKHIVKLTKGTGVNAGKYSIGLAGLYAPATVEQSQPVTAGESVVFYTPVISNAGYAAFQADTEEEYSALHRRSEGDIVGWTANAAASEWTIEDATSVDITISDAGYATTYLPFPVTVPGSVTAYTVTINADGVHLDLESVGETIPAGTPVILEGDANTYNFVIAEDVAAIDHGVLTGTYTQIAATDGSYILQNQGGNVGFYQVNTTEAQPNVPGFRAYLTVPSSVKAFFFNGGTDAIKSVFSGIAEGKIFDLSGRKVAKMQKGNTYIVNGKKVNVK